MLSMYGNGKTWVEMTPEEQKMCLIVVGIMVLGLVAYGIYYFLRIEKINKRFVVFCRNL